MKSSYSFVLALFLSATAEGQNVAHVRWPGTNNIMSTTGYKTIRMADERLAMAGVWESDNGAAIALLVMDDAFNVEISRGYRPTGQEIFIDGDGADTTIYQTPFVSDLIQTADGGFAISGLIDSSAMVQYDGGVMVSSAIVRRSFVMRTNAVGQVQWSSRMTAAADRAVNIFQLAQNDSGDLLAFGALSEDSLVSTDALLMVLGAGGVPQVTVTYGGPQAYDLFTDVVRAGDRWVVCGSTESFGTQRRAWMSGIGEDYAMDWSRIYGNVPFGYARSVVYDADTNQLLLLTSELSDQGTAKNMAVTRTDVEGGVVSSWRMGVNTLDSPADLWLHEDGSMWVVGTVDNFSQSDLLATRLNAAGECIWTRVLGDQTVSSGPDGIKKSNEVALSALPATDGRILITGYQDSLVDPDLQPVRVFRKAYHALVGSEWGGSCLVEQPAPFSEAISVEAESVTPAVAEPLVSTSTYAYLDWLLDPYADTLCTQIVTAVDAPVWRHDAALMPNPATQEVTLVLPIPVNGNWWLMDASGRCCATGTLRGERLLLDVSERPAGLYNLLWSDPAKDRTQHRRLQVVH
jgi:hypothetical protein